MTIYACPWEFQLNIESAKRIKEVACEVGAFLQGEFTLASGRTSDRYFDGKLITLSQEGAYEVGKVIAEELEGTGVNAVGGLATGAYPIVTAVALMARQRGWHISTFIVREQRKKHGTMRKIEGHLKEGSRVVIVDDVITTGGSVIKAIKAVERANCQVAKVIVLVDRVEGGSDKLLKMGYDFTALIKYPSGGEVIVEESAAVAGDAAGGAIRK